MPSKGNDLVRAMTQILSALYSHEDDTAIRDIAAECSIPKSTLHRVLQMLKEEGWVYQGEDNGYRIGLRLLVLASQSRLRMEMVRQLDPVMRQLSKLTSQTVVLNVLDSNQSVCLHTIESNKRIRLYSQVGARGPLHAGASGKVLLAFGPVGLLDEILTGPIERFTPFTLTAPEALRREVEKIRKDRYAVSIEELDPGAAAIAVPILDSNGDLIAGISLAGPRFDFEGKIEAWVGEMLQVTAGILGDGPNRKGRRAPC